MERFQLTAQLQTPVIIGGGYLTLDALLGCILFEKLQDVDEAHKQIPLACSDGLFHGSLRSPQRMQTRLPGSRLEGGCLSAVIPIF